MSVEHPLRLVAGALAAIAFAWVYARIARSAGARALAYTNVAFFEAAIKPRRWIPLALQAAWIAAFALVVLGLSGPRLRLPVPVRDGSAFICIDTSGSMASTDVDPTRAQAATAAARAFIAQTAPGTRVGIIAFATSASVIQPPSADRDAVSASLAQVPLPNGATAIGDALALAAQMLPPAGHRVVVLITDGVNNAGTDPMQAAQWLGAHHVPVYTIGIGTQAGGLIPGTNEEATIDEDALQAYARVSGGAYARAQDATQLRAALARLGRVTSVERKRVDASLGFTAAGALGMLLVFLAGFSLGRYP